MITQSRTCETTESQVIMPGNVQVLKLVDGHAHRQNWFQFTEVPGEILLVDALCEFEIAFTDPYLDVEILEPTSAYFVAATRQAPNAERESINPAGVAEPLTAPTKHVRATISPYGFALGARSGLSFYFGIEGRRGLPLKLKIIIGAEESIIKPKSCAWTLEGISDTDPNRLLGPATLP
jgi:hypothetical protein